MRRKRRGPIIWPRSEVLKSMKGIHDRPDGPRPPDDVEFRDLEDGKLQQGRFETIKG